MPKLPLHFKGRKVLLSNVNKMYSNRPVPVWQITALENGSTSQGSPGFAMLTLILKNGLLLVVLLTSILSAGYSNIISYLLEI